MKSVMIVYLKKNLGNSQIMIFRFFVELLFDFKVRLYMRQCVVLLMNVLLLNWNGFGYF